MKQQIEKMSFDRLKKEYIPVPNHMHEHWKKDWGKSYSRENFFDHDELEWLTDLMYKQHTERRVRKNGTLHFVVDNELIKEKFFDKLKSAIPELDDSEWWGNFLITSTPYNLHIDTGTHKLFDKKPEKAIVPGKQFIIPLYVCWTGNKDKPDDWHPECGTAIMKNRFVRYGTNFAKTDQVYDTDVADTLRDYTGLVCYDHTAKQMDVDWSSPFDNDTYQKYLTHYNKRWLDGMELENVFNWKRGSLIVFDRCQAHSGVDFRKNGVTLKAGLSLMTTKRVQL